MRRLLIAACLILPILAVAGWLDGGGGIVLRQAGPDPVAANSAVPHVPVIAVPARRADVPIFLTGIGTVEAFNTVLVKSQVDGQIVKIDFAEGQTVHAGDVLAEIDPRVYQAALELATATKLKDQAQLDNARLDLARAIRLLATGSGTTQSRDATNSTVAQLQASVQADQAAIDAAQIRLNFTKIRAPLDGRAGTRKLDVGNIVQASDLTGIVTINQIQPVSVSFDFPSQSLPSIRAATKAGDVVVTALDSDGNALATGKVSVIDNQINVATSTIRYKATFANADEALWPGEFVDVRLLLSLQRNAITIPITARLQSQDGTYAFVVGPGQVIEKRPIQVGFANQQVAVVAGGLQPGELVVTDGQYRIQAGTTVDLLPQAAHAPDEQAPALIGTGQ